MDNHVTSQPVGTDQIPGAIAGMGMDLLRIPRLEQTMARRGERFAQKILGPDEWLVYQRRKARDPRRGLRYLATRFCAKEAFSKAVGLGMRHPMWWNRMQTLNQRSGRPEVVLAGELLEWYVARFGGAHISLTDETDLAAATVIVEKKV
ncbi:holo-ACP synthase [Kerstersia gyiorum]|uniref:holo-ACP synthase n=1 Tax=Kerstersia gyiorum TaxID=206506 RepID=UPI0021504B25|nr:holo-ACP synthase [Kerstersia gyiorum]MCR4158510.1 holo-ACP synthase [Kerstersia gyiorum]